MPLPIHLFENERYISLLMGERRLSLHKGDVVSLSCDALVCPVDQNLDFRSGVARVISQAAGRGIRSERPLTPAPFGKVVVLPGGDLKVKYIFLSVVLGERDVPKIRSCIQSAVERSIRYAEFLRLRSIAFPVLGCPRSNPPYGSVAKEMLEMLIQYLQKRNTKLKAILVSVYNSNAFEAFRKEARSITNI